MDSEKVGKLLAELRKERGLTQREVAQRLHISDKTVSKWETGQGLPDVSLLGGLSGLFGVPVERILAGDMTPGQSDGGNMKRLKFYVCPTCGSFLSGTGGAEVSCCGKKLSPLKPRKGEGEHAVSMESMDGEWYLTFDHPMTKDHHLAFVAWVGFDRVFTVKLYPEGPAAARLPRPQGGEKLFWYCTWHGLFEGPGTVR